MKTKFRKTVTIILSLLLLLSTVTACGSEEAVTAAPEAKAAAPVYPAIVTFEADGKQICFEDIEGKSVEQLLEEAEITLQPGDVLSVKQDHIPTDNLTIQVLRKCTVTVVVAAEEPAEDVRYTAVLLGGTVADAIDAVNVQLNDQLVVNLDLDAPLTDKLEILISPKPEEPTEPEPTEPETTEPEEEEDDDYDYDYDYSDSDTSWEPEPTTPPATTPPEPTAPPATEPTPTEPPTEPPAPTDPPRTVVSVEVYEDCDGSGHGVKVITYSDGTQEEVYF